MKSQLMNTEFLTNKEDILFSNAERACYFIKAILEDTDENDELDRCAADMYQSKLLNDIFY